MISQDEISKRKPVWLVLSEFYLDTELRDADFQRISKILKESGYSLKELKRINYEEVAPVVSPNTYSVAGEWTGFNEEWLIEEIVKRLNQKKGNSIFNKIYKKYIDSITNNYWEQIVKYVPFNKPD